MAKKKKKKGLWMGGKVAFPFKKGRGLLDEDEKPRQKLSDLLLGKKWKRGALAALMAKKEK